MRIPILATLLMASMLLVPGCTPTPRYAFPVVQKYTAKAGDLFYFRPSDGRFVLVERKEALAVAVAPAPRIQIYAYDSRIAIGRPQGSSIEIRSFVEKIRPQQALAITADGQTLAGGDESGFATLWNTETGQTQRQWKELTAILGAAFSPDGKMLAIGLEKPIGKSMETVRLWDLDANALRRSFGERDVSALAWTADGRLLAAGEGNGNILLTEAAGTAAPRRLQGSTAAVTALDFHPSGMFLAAAHADMRVVIWKVPTAEAVFTFEPDVPADPLFPRGIERVAFDPTGNRMAVAYSDGTFRTWDTIALSKAAR